MAAISNRNDFSYCWFKSHPDASLPSFKHFASGEEVNNRCSRWPSLRSSWISDRNDFSYFWSTSPRCFLSSFESIGFSVQEKKQKIDLQDSGHGGHLGFPIGTILAIFHLQICFLSTNHPNASFQVSSQMAQGCGRSRLLKQLLMPHDGRRTTHDRHWLITTAHPGLRWAKKKTHRYFSHIHCIETLEKPTRASLHLHRAFAEKIKSRYGGLIPGVWIQRIWRRRLVVYHHENTPI